MTAADLERSQDNLRAVLQRILDDIDRLKADMALTEAGLSHHKHDWTRDVTGQPTTYAPDTHTHDSLYATTSHNHDGSYATIGHTHTGFASNTHVHNYNDYQPKDLQYNDVSRTTSGPV